MRKPNLAAFSALLALLAVLAPGLAPAQSRSAAYADQPAPATGAAAPAGSAAPEIGVTLQEVTVSASAITLSGYDQPTPVTSIGIQQIQSAAQPDLSDALRDLPDITGSGPQNANGNIYVSSPLAGADTVSIRGVGSTLVLFDGQRVGGADAGTIPTTLVQRVDVVKGGASAIWGSDAIAGVINYIINHNFNGVQINLQDSNNNTDTHEQYSADITAGTGFDGDRGHIEASFSEHRVPRGTFNYQLEGYNAQWLLNNPACSLTAVAGETKDSYTGLYCPPGQPTLVHANNVNVVDATPGGIITNCTGQKGSCPLTGTYFVGPNATPTHFNPGNDVTSGYLSSGGTANTVENTLGLEGTPWSQQSGFVFGSFKLNDHVEATLQFDYGSDGVWADTTSRDQLGTETTYSGNPFIPASIQSTMTADGITSLSMGTTNTNPFTGPAPSVQAWQNSIGTTVLYEGRRLMRGVFGLDGDLGNNWSWKAYYEESETRGYESVTNEVTKASLADAEDAVTVGGYNAHYTAAKYPNPLGLPTGTVTCTSNLLPIGASGETNNCVPLDIFGTGGDYQAAINYVNTPSLQGGDFEHTDDWERVGAATVQGKLPVGTPAGPVALAAGVVWRQEFAREVNCGTYCTNSLFYSGNFAPFYGNYNIKEGSLELNAPLLKDHWVKDLSVDAAYRAIQYSTSGTVQTYKFGLLSQLTDAVRFRASYSVDIQAGSLTTEFTTASTPVGSDVVDPRTGVTVLIHTVSTGNPAILPQQAETRSAGFVFTPVQSLIGSLDWFYVMEKREFGSVGGTQAEELCQAGYSQLCEELVWGTYPGGCTGPSFNSCPGQPLAAIVSKTVNLNSETEAGVDFLADYRMPFLAGSLDFNTNENYIMQQRRTNLGNTCDALNSLGSDEGQFQSCTGGEPKFRGNAGVSYSQAGWLGSVQARMVGQAYLATQWIGQNKVDNNNIPFYTVVDLRLAYRFANGISLYGAIDNVGNRYPPVIASSPISGFETEQPPFDDTIYDVYGVVWRLGLRAKF